MPDQEVLEGQETRKSTRFAAASAAATLQTAYLNDRGDRAATHARATLASLRHAVSSSPQHDPIAWQEVLELAVPYLPDELIGHSDYPSRAERAVFDALTLFSLHMQSQHVAMHQAGKSFAKAVGELIARRDSESIKPRFDAVVLARNEQTRRHHLRSLVALLRAEAIGFDYGWFASDLAQLSHPSSSRRNAVLLRWGRDVVLGQMPARPSDTEHSTVNS